MNFNVMVIFFLTTFVSFQTFGAEHRSFGFITKFNGQEITPQSVMYMIESERRDPKFFYHQALALAAMCNYKDLFQKITDLSVCGPYCEVVTSECESNVALRAQGLENKSLSSFAIRIKSSKNDAVEVMIKVAGPTKRRGNLNLAISEELNQPSRTWLAPVIESELHTLKQVTGKDPVTYQNISRLVGYLLFQECKRHWQIEHQGQTCPLEAVPVYPLAIAGRDALNISDYYYCTFEPFIQGLKPLNEYPTIAINAHDAIKYFILNGALWDMNKDNFGVKDGKVWCLDLEQPAESSPFVFPFTKDHTKPEGHPYTNGGFNRGHFGWALQEADALIKGLKSDAQK